MKIEKTYTLKELLVILPFSRSSLYTKMKNGSFPQAIPFRSKNVLWRKRDVIDWLKDNGMMIEEN